MARLQARRPAPTPAQIIRQAQRLEAPFAANQYDGRARPHRGDFVWLAGTGPILISAPHAVNHRREGRIKYADRYTGAIAREVQRATRRPLIARTQGPHGDPNWDLVSPYKKAIGAAAQRGQIGCVLDLHGAARRHHFDVALGTAGRGISRLDEIVAVFERAGLSQVVVDGARFNANHPGTVTWYVAHRLGLPALQIEINGFYRNPVRRPIAYRQAEAALIDLVDLLGERCR